MFLWANLVGLFCLVLVLDRVSAKDLTLTILHTNDVHDRIDEFDAKGNPCSQQLRQSNQCFGGIARQKFMVDRYRKANGDRTIFLDGGDFSLGTMWYYLFKANIVADSFEHLRHDAVALGNHEFDEGSIGLLPLLERADKLGIPVLGCNVDFSKNSILQKYQPKKSIVLVKSGVKIGLIGYLTPTTMRSSRVDNGTVITDEIESIAREAKVLHDQGIKIIIVVGHSGYEKDIEIAEKVPLVNVVVGGHSHTFLSSSSLHTGDKAMGAYPTVVHRDGGDKALVVQDFWTGKYLGRINVTFDAETGRVQSWQGNSPILLDHTVPKDPEVEKFVQEKRLSVDEYANTYIGANLFDLDNVRCRKNECALGNLVTEGISDHFVARNVSLEANFRWKAVDIVVVNAGAMRSALRKGNVTAGDVAALYPYSNLIWVLTISGAEVKKMYEISFHQYELDGGSSYGGFLHSTGTRIVADVTRPVNDRILSIDVLCAVCDSPKWEPLDMTKKYRVAMADYLALGGSMYDFGDLSGDRVEKLTVRDTDLVRAFIAKTSVLYPSTDGRIRIITAKDANGCEVVVPIKSSAISQRLPFSVLVSMLCTLLLIRLSSF